MSNIGDIYLFNNKEENSLYSKLQRFFTKMPYTHTSLGVGFVLEYLSVLSSDKLCYIQPLNKYLSSGQIESEMYKVKFGTDEEKLEILKTLHYEFSGTTYGYKQLVWFVYRWLAEKFHKDVRGSHNWLADKNVVCSELTFIYLEELAKKYKLTDLMLTLNEWRKDNVHVGDIKNILERFPHYFTKL